MKAEEARRLLRAARAEPDRNRQFLLVGAAITQILSTEPVVVGGTAQDYYTAPLYRPTDLDLCAPVTGRDADELRKLGFVRSGGHWVHDRTNVAVEFPEAAIDGDPERTTIFEIGAARVRIIGVDDLYLDRVRQATATESESDQAFQGAVVIAVARYEEIDWLYVKKVVDATRTAHRTLGEAMARINRKVRRRAKAAI